MIMSLKQMKLNPNIYTEFYDVIAKKMCRITFKIDRGFYPTWQAPVCFLVSLYKAREENTCVRGACPRNPSLRPHKSGT